MSLKPKIFKIDMKESPKDLQARHAYMMNLPETKILMYKMNPGEIKLFEAAFGQEGPLGELIVVIDSKVKGILLNRVRMNLQPFEIIVVQEPKDKNKQARKSKFIKLPEIDENSIIEEDYGGESSYDSEDDTYTED